MLENINLVIIILDDLKRLPALLSSWRDIGVGATLVNSQGGYRLGNWMDRLGLGALSRLIEQGDSDHEQRLVLSLIQDPDILDRAIAEAERIMEGFYQPNSGILFVIPVAKVLGLQKQQAAEVTKGSSAEPEKKPEQPGIGANTPVADIIQILDLESSVVHMTDPIEKVVQVMLEHPSIKVVAVVSNEEHLVGIIDTAALSEALFFEVFPEAFLTELHDVDQVMDFFKKPHDVHTAADIMEEPAYVHADDSLTTAFRTLKKRKLLCIPVVDKNNHVISYIDMLEIMAISVLERGISVRRDRSDE